MKTISSAIFYMSEWQAIFQCQEYIAGNCIGSDVGLGI